MKPTTAQGLRRLGLAILAVFLMAHYALVRQKIEPRRFLGISQYQALMAGMALGFVLWWWGTVAFYSSKKKDPGAVSSWWNW